MLGRTLVGSASDLKVEAIYRSTVGDESALHLCRTAHFLARVRPKHAMWPIRQRATDWYSAYKIIADHRCATCPSDCI